MADEGSTATANTNTDAAPAATTQTEGKGTLLTPGEPAKTEPAKSDASTTPAKEGEGTTPAKEGESTEAKTAESESKAKGAPETYTDFTVEKGLELNPEAMTAFTAIAKEAGLSQEQAQKFVDIATKNNVDAQKSRDDAFLDTRDKWVGEIKGDKELGGPKFDETVVRAQRALKNFGTPELAKFLENGLGDHPEVIRLLVKFDTSTGEDITVPGGPPATEKSAAQTIYPNM